VMSVLSQTASHVVRRVLGSCALTVRSGPNRGMKRIVGAGIHQCWLGAYEREKQAAIAKVVRPGMTLYDVGAHAGFYTLLFSRLTGNAGRVYAFEPCPFGLRYLLEHVRLNDLQNVKVIQAAVADTANLEPMSIGMDSYQNRLSATARTPLLVPTLSLDSFGGSPPDLIKIDVEGAEARVLEGSQRILRDVRPAVFLALHGEDQRRQCAAILRDSGYELQTLDGAPITGPITTDEVVALSPGRQVHEVSVG
jgi:FkbM family methyltransferase